jgi:Protein of unknown function (DUF5818)
VILEPEHSQGLAITKKLLVGLSGLLLVARACAANFLFLSTPDFWHDTCISLSMKQNSTTGGTNIMKSLGLFRLLGSVALLIGLANLPLFGQDQQQPNPQDPTAQSQTQSQPSQPVQPQTSMTPQSTPSQPSQLFVGKIAKSKGDVVLKADAGVSYRLDNTDQAMQYVGKTVHVTGTLDTATNTIHVTNIEPPPTS